MSAYEVIAADWRKPKVVRTLYSRAEADRHADRVDGLALRCYVREVDEDVAQGRSIVEQDAREGERRG